MSCLMPFQPRDLLCPRPVLVLPELYAEDRLQEKVVAVTNDSQKSPPYLVVRVDELSEPVMVPVDRTSPQSAH